jgi:hypothetical protein
MKDHFEVEVIINEGDRCGLDQSQWTNWTVVRGRT